MLVINIFILKFFFQNFFSNIYLNFFFEGFTLNASLFSKTKWTLYVSVIKNMICSKRSKWDFRLLWCIKYSFSVHTADITLDVKSPISFPCWITILICFSVKHNIEELLLNKLSRYFSFNSFFCLLFLINLRLFENRMRRYCMHTDWIRIGSGPLAMRFSKIRFSETKAQ